MQKHENVSRISRFRLFVYDGSLRGSGNYGPITPIFCGFLEMSNIITCTKFELKITNYVAITAVLKNFGGFGLGEVPEVMDRFCPFTNLTSLFTKYVRKPNFISLAQKLLKLSH